MRLMEKLFYDRRIPRTIQDMLGESFLVEREC
jgi:hypothetical protein